MPQERLQKVLAAAGVASRRASEKLITAGRVQVDGRTVTELGTKVDPATAHITVDGRPIHQQRGHTYLKLYKPRGVISDMGGDAVSRRNVADLLPANAGRVFPVGRLDLNSEGLMLLTDDGDLAHKLTHPRYEHPKTYLVLVGRRPTESALHRLRAGVTLPDYRTAPAKARVIERLPAGLQLDAGPSRGVWLEIVLREGKKRQIRHMTAAVGYPTLRLVRWAIGPLTMANLAPGQVAPLKSGEVSALRRLAAGKRQA
jgi:23S rRNA pseudouridine2605 synthase